MFFFSKLNVIISAYRLPAIVCSPSNHICYNWIVTWTWTMQRNHFNAKNIFHVHKRLIIIIYGRQKTWSQVNIWKIVRCDFRFYCIELVNCHKVDIRITQFTNIDTLPGDNLYYEHECKYANRSACVRNKK